MIKILKSKKGMTLVEVVISITMLGVILVPLMALFSTSVILANKNRDKVDLNYLTEIVVEEVRASVKTVGRSLPTYESYDPSSKDYTEYTISLVSLVEESKNDGTKKTTEEIGIVGPISDSTDQYRPFSYKVEYDHSSCYDDRYPNTYEFVIYIYQEGEMVKKLKVPVWDENKLIS